MAAFQVLAGDTMRSSDEKWMFTSESLAEGHPDKVCDQISDSVLDAIYREDPAARVACETVAGTGFIVVTGEITTKPDLDVQGVVRGVLEKVGYKIGRAH